MNESNSMI